MSAIYGPLEEDEWSTEWFLADCDYITEHPPTPEGVDLVECTAEPRHWPMYVAHLDGMYPSHCILCERDDLARQLRKVECEREHRRWKSWRVWWWLGSRLYVLGITASGGGVSMGRCEFCGVGRQHIAPRWRGKRPYLLGLKREVWGCLRRGHRRSETSYGLCSICCPCPSCGSVDPEHSGDCGGAS